MRETRVVQASIFEFYSEYEFGTQLHKSPINYNPAINCVATWRVFVRYAQSVAGCGVRLHGLLYFDIAKSHVVSTLY